MTTEQHSRGFTLLELMVAVAIIAVIAAFLIIRVQSAKVKALGVETLNDFEQTTKAFQIWFESENRTTWWTDPEFDFLYGPGIPRNNPPISILIERTPLGQYMRTAPQPPPQSDAVYEYDNDGDTFECGQYPAYLGGINLFLEKVDYSYFETLDKMIDREDGPTCGTITAYGDLNKGSMGGTILGYHIAN